MYIVTLKTVNGTCYLRRTIWTFADARDRATEYPTRDAAYAALKRAKPFMPAKLFNAAQIEEA